MKRILGISTLALIVFLTACTGNNITIGQIPPPPVRPTPPPVVQPQQTQVVVGNVIPDDVYVLSFSHNTNMEHPRGYMAARFAELVEARSGGRMIVNVFPEQQLGSDSEVVTQVMQGTIDLTAIFSPNVTHVVPELALFDLPYLFFTMEQAQNALNGALGDYLADAMAEQGLTTFGYFTSGFKDFTNNVRPIYSVLDMDGLRMRVSQSHFLVAQFQAMNAGGISIAWGEVYGAIEAGLADGQENPLATIVTARLYEVQDYITISNHGITVYPIFMSTEVYNQLPADLRLILRQTFAEIQPLQWQMIAEATDTHLEYLYSTGVSINYLSETAQQGFRIFMQDIYDEFAQTVSSTLLSIAGRYVE